MHTPSPHFFFFFDQFTAPRCHIYYIQVVINSCPQPHHSSLAGAWRYRFAAGTPCDESSRNRLSRERSAATCVTVALLACWCCGGLIKWIVTMVSGLIISEQDRICLDGVDNQVEAPIGLISLVIKSQSWMMLMGVGEAMCAVETDQN